MNDAQGQSAPKTRQAVAGEELIVRARSGDEAAAGQLVADCQAQVLRVCRFLMDTPEDARDAAQEALLKMLRHLDTFDERRPLAPWLYRLTVNVCRDLQRRQGRRRRIVVADAGDDLDRQVVASGDGADVLLEIRERRRLLSRALASLTRRERAALVLRDLEGLSTREVAATLGAAPVTIRVHIASARRKIRLFWQRHDGRTP